MTIEEDRLILNEFAEWRERRAADVVDLSHEAFLQEREAQANERRIAEALEILAPVGNDGAFPSDYTAEDAERYKDALRTVERILIDDRPYILDQTFSGPPTRIFT